MTWTGAPSDRSVFVVIRPSALSNAAQARAAAQLECTYALTALLAHYSPANERHLLSSTRADPPVLAKSAAIDQATDQSA